MNLSFGEGNSINVDFTLTTSNITTINTQLKTIFDSIKTYDAAQILAMKNDLNNLYQTLNNFSKFLSEYEELKEEVML